MTDPKPAAVSEASVEVELERCNIEERYSVGPEADDTTILGYCALFRGPLRSTKAEAERDKAVLRPLTNMRSPVAIPIKVDELGQVHGFSYAIYSMAVPRPKDIVVIRGRRLRVVFVEWSPNESLPVRLLVTDEA